MNEESINILKALSDKSRIFILNALMKKSSYVEEIAEIVQLAPSTVSFHLNKLEKVGLVKREKEQYYKIYTLNKEMLEKSLLDLIQMEKPEEKAQEEKEEKYRQKVLKTFFKYDKLIQIPVGRKKRRVILDKIAESFEFGKKYTEREVNIIIADFNDDFCFIRRSMIEEKIMARENGIYWLIND